MSTNEQVPPIFTKEQQEAIIQIMKDNIQIESEMIYGSYGSGDSLEIKILVANTEISSIYVDVKE